MGKVRIKIGDVFTIPVDDARVGIGQVVAKYRKSAEYFAVFDKTYGPASLPVPAVAVREPLLLLALSLDAKLYHGDWQVIGNEPVASGIRLPAYKEAIGTPENIQVVDYSGERRRAATADEVDRLPFRAIVSPALVEMALRAKHGLEPWDVMFDDLEPHEETSMSRLF